jgi:hypothetical protein
VRGIGWALSAAAATGCGFQLSTNGAAGGDVEVDAGADSAQPDASPEDTAPVARKMFAAANTQLYEIDVDARMATLIGEIRAGNETFDVDGLAWDGTQLIGLSAGATELLIIDSNTAAVSARRTISPAGVYGGLTVAPAGEAGPTAVVFAGSATKLVTIDIATGAVTQVGAFGNWGGNLTFFSDLAWLNGALHVTLQGGYCNTRCFARVNHTTGLSMTPFRYDLTGDLYGLSGYGGSLWALHNAGPVLEVDQTTGKMTEAFDPLITWTEAAQ